MISQTKEEKMKHLDQSIRVAVDDANPSIQRIESKCIQCGMCAKICTDVIGVNGKYDLSQTGGHPVCVHCGQCVKCCPVDSLVERQSYRDVRAEMNMGKVVIVSTAPAVRVGLGECFGMPYGSFVQGKMVALLKALGFSYVLDVDFGADLTVCEEAHELLSRVRSGERLPMFSSCCPSWVKYAEMFYPDILPHLSTCRSPISMQGPVIKTYFAQQLGINPDDIVNVCLTPCVAKKYEISREELNVTSRVYGIPHMRDTDYCITTTELAQWARESGIDFDTLPDAEYDSLMGQSSGAGVIFGQTGGVAEATARTMYRMATGRDATDMHIDWHTDAGLRVGTVDMDGTVVRLAVVNGLANLDTLVSRMRAGEQYHFVEVMACPGGCVGGGGLPKHGDRDTDATQSRQQALLARDQSMGVRVAHANAQIKALYDQYLTAPHSELAITLLHTFYTDRSTSLNAPKNAHICPICGCAYTSQDTHAVCPSCHSIR